MEDLLKKQVILFRTLTDVLKAYSGEDRLSSAIADLETIDVIWSMAEENDMTEEDMKDWIVDNANTRVRCSVRNVTGRHPEVRVVCADKVFSFDWVEE